MRVGDGYIEPKSSQERLVFMFAVCTLICLISYMASRCALGNSVVSIATELVISSEYLMCMFICV